MCGFAGFYSKENFPKDSRELLLGMGESISHRGPDSSGVWFNNSDGIGFSHEDYQF